MNKKLKDRDANNSSYENDVRMVDYFVNRWFLQK